MACERDGGRVTAADTTATRTPRLHWAWVVAAVSFIAILGAAGFRSVPGVMMNPLHHEFGWSHGVVGLRDVGQHDVVRTDRAVRSRPDGPARRATGADGGDTADRDGIGAERDDDRELAAGAAVGRAGRCGHRLDLAGLRRARGDALVRDEAWLGHRRADCGERDRAADISADRRRGEYHAQLVLGIVIS